MISTDHLTLIITFVAIGGALCFLGGLSLLCIVSKKLTDAKAEAVFLMGIGFFIIALCSITWKLTEKNRNNDEDNKDAPDMVSPS